MHYVEYIQNGNSNANSTGWSIPLNYHPSVTSNVKMRVKINRLNTFDGNLTVGAVGGAGNYFRFFTYQQGKMFFDCPDDSDARIGLAYTPETPTIWEMGTTGASDYYLSNLTNGTTTATTVAKSRTFTKDFFVYGETTDKTISEYQKIYYIEIYENDVKVKDYRPAVDDLGVVCLYETIGESYHYNQGSKTLTAGPILSSVVATPSKKVLASTGETINIAVACENAWTVTGNTWLTLSTTGGTGDTTITATAPNYSGSTNRDDNLTFIDSVTGDEFPLTIKQRNNTGGGMPFVIGDIEVLEAYVGDIPLGEAYLGEDLVFSSGPFSGLKLSPKNIKFLNVYTSAGTTSKLYVKSSEDWALTTDADWFTLSPSTGVGNSEKTEVTLTVTSLPSSDTTNVISCTTTSFSASSEVLYKVGYGIPANEIWYATINESRITSLNEWKVYDKSGQQMSNAACDFSTYGKLVFNADIGCVGGFLRSVMNGWSNITELGLPEMDITMCVGAKDFGMSYISSPMSHWTRVYGDYPYIDETETMAWASDGLGLIVARGKTGELVMPEGPIACGVYGMNQSCFSSIVFPKSLVGGVGSYNNGLALGAYMCEDMPNLTSIKYKSLTAPTAGSSPFNRVNNNGVMYYPSGGAGTYPKPSNFTSQTY